MKTERRPLRIGMYPFASTADIEGNLWAIERASAAAAAANVKLLVFHECAICGYPPIETMIEQLDPGEIGNALSRVSNFAKHYGIFIAVGTVRFARGKRFNSVVVYDEQGARIGHYDKKALWGWDTDHFTRGGNLGIIRLDGVKIGFRICYDIRFPELFRELYLRHVDVCAVCFSDTSEQPDPERYGIIRSHLVTRAVENAMTVLSVNSISRCQTAPTAVFAPGGRMVLEAAANKEGLVFFDYQKPDPTFGMKSIAENANRFLGVMKNPE